MAEPVLHFLCYVSEHAQRATCIFNPPCMRRRVTVVGSVCRLSHISPGEWKTRKLKAETDTDGGNGNTVDC